MLRVQIDSDNDIEGFSQFYDYEEFKVNMEIWLIDHQQEFSRGEIMGLNQLIQFSSKVPGVCHVAIGKIVCCKDLDLDEHAISRSTFKRMVWKCIHFGMLKVYETENKNGAQCCNLYVFNRYPTWDEPISNKYMDGPNPLPHTKTKDMHILIEKE